MHIDSSLWIEKNDKGFLGKGRIDLLKQINTHGSLSKAAKAMKMSYKGAWDSLNVMKKLSHEELIISNTGGAGGGGSTLTKKAHQYIKMYELLFDAQQKFLQAIESNTNDFEDLQSFLQRSSLRTSARNQLFGKVTHIQKSRINSILTISINKNLNILASITNTSIDELCIKKGKNVYALIKASWVKIKTEGEQNKDNSNSIVGKIEHISKEDNILEILIVTDEKLFLTSVMEFNEFNALHVKEGDRVIASFRPSDIIIGI